MELFDHFSCSPHFLAFLMALASDLTTAPCSTPDPKLILRFNGLDSFLGLTVDKSWNLSMIGDDRSSSSTADLIVTSFFTVAWTAPATVCSDLICSSFLVLRGGLYASVLTETSVLIRASALMGTSGLNGEVLNCFLTTGERKGFAKMLSFSYNYFISPESMCYLVITHLHSCHRLQPQRLCLLQSPK